jgi:hypothetical protein
MRQVRKMHEQVVSCYMNLAQLVVFVPLVYFTGSDLTIWRQFNYIDLVCLFGVGTLTIINQVCRFRALKLSEASRLQPYSFLRPL